MTFLAAQSLALEATEPVSEPVSEPISYVVTQMALELINNQTHINPKQFGNSLRTPVTDCCRCGYPLVSKSYN